MPKTAIAREIESIAASIGSETRRLEGKTLLIAGGAGFLGRWMVAVLQCLNAGVLRKPCRALVLDNYITGSRKNIVAEIKDPHIQFIEHDVRKPLSMRGAADFIIHAAGIASPVHYKSHPVEAIESAIFGAKHLLELAKDKKAESFLFFSSSEIYGDPDPRFIPTPETYLGNVSCIGPRSCYDESKRLGETLSMTYFHRYGIPVKIVRPFNVYGPGMTMDDFRVIPNFLTRALHHEPLPVHLKGNQTRSFCYVTDAITGFFKVLLSSANGEVYNVGNDEEEIRMQDLAAVVAGLFEPPAAVEHVEYPKSYPKEEPQRRVPDLTKIKHALGFQPKVSLKSGLERTLAWCKETLAKGRG